ncbi:MAG: hypothetical protein HYZ43_07160 [Flavobacteriia bacterium]|nr:hypothetical protein [Flavobacteriia bacterium]
MENTKKDRTQLKSYFRSNAAPTEQNFKDFIDAGLNQKEDGIAKIQDGPLAIEAVGSSQDLLHFYAKFSDVKPAWKLSQKIGDRPGFLLLTGNDVPRLFIDSESGKTGIGTKTPSGRLHVYEETGSIPSADTGAFVLEHGDLKGQSSIVFKTKNNRPTDIGYITYQEEATEVPGGNTLTIGTQASPLNHVALMPSGNVGIGTKAPTAKLDVNGTVRLKTGNQGVGKVLTSDLNGVASWAQPQVRRDYRPYGTPTYVWDGTTTTAENGADPTLQLSVRGAAVFEKYNNFVPWFYKSMFTLSNLSTEAVGTDTPPANGIYLTLPATPGIHNALLVSGIDRDRWSVITVWLCDAAGNNGVKIARSSNNANGSASGLPNDGSAVAGNMSSYLIGPRNATKEVNEHAWMTFPITADQVASYSSNGNLKFIITTGYNYYTNHPAVFFLSGFALVPNQYGFTQHPGLVLHWGLNGNVSNDLKWHSIWNNEGLVKVDSLTTSTIFVKVIDPNQDLLVTFYEHNAGWHGGTLLITVGSNKQVFSPSDAFIGIGKMLYSGRAYSRPQSILIPKEIVKAQLVKTASAVPSMLQLVLRNPGGLPYHFRGVDTEIFF